MSILSRKQYMNVDKYWYFNVVNCNLIKLTDEEQIHVSEQLSYISHAGIPYAFGFRGQCSMYR